MIDLPKKPIEEGALTPAVVREFASRRISDRSSLSTEDEIRLDEIKYRRARKSLREAFVRGSFFSICPIRSAWDLIKPNDWCNRPRELTLLNHFHCQNWEELDSEDFELLKRLIRDLFKDHPRAIPEDFASLELSKARVINTSPEKVVTITERPDGMKVESTKTTIGPGISTTVDRLIGPEKNLVGDNPYEESAPRVLFLAPVVGSLIGLILGVVSGLLIYRVLFG